MTRLGWCSKQEMSTGKNEVVMFEKVEMHH